MHSINNKGMSLVYVMICLIIIGLTTTALIRMSHKSSMTQLQYSNSESARLAVRAGFDNAITLFESKDKETQKKVVALLQEWLDKDTPSHIENPWIVGDEDETEEINSDCAFKVQILGFDHRSFAVTLQSQGIGKGNAKASAIGTYIIDGLGFKTVEQNLWENENALYLGDGIEFTMHGPLEIQGACYFGTGVNLGAHCSGSIFNGIFRTGVSSTTQITMRGEYTFNGPTYFGMKQYTDGGSQFNYNNKVGFEYGLRWVGSNSADMSQNAYWNRGTIGAGTIDMFGNTVVHYSPYKISGTMQTNNFTKKSIDSKLNILDSLFISSAVCEIDVDVDAIDDNLILDYEDFDTPLSGGSHSFNGSIANKIFNYASTEGMLWNGFAILEIDYTVSIFDDDVDFTDKMIVIVSSGGKLQPGSTGGCFDTAPGANFTILSVDGGEVQNIGGWDYFRSFMYCDETSTFVVGGSENKTDNVHGAIHAQGGASVQWYPKYEGNAFVKFEQKVLNELSYDGLITLNEDCNDSVSTSTDSTTLIIKAPSLTTELLSRSF